MQKYYLDLINKYKSIDNNTIDFTMTKEYISITVTNKKTKKSTMKQFKLSSEDPTFEKSLQGV